MLDQLDEDPTGGGGMKEGDAVTPCAVARLAIDQTYAGPLEALKLPGKPGDAVGDMVQARPPTGEEATDGRLGSEWLEELHRSHEGHAHALRFEDFRIGTFLARQEFEHGPIIRDGGNRDGHVVQRSIG